MTKRIILLEEGTAALKELMGPKAAGLADMVQAGWPVPAGFVVAASGFGQACAHSGQPSCDKDDELADAIRYLEQRSGKRFGHAANPLLLAVRSGGTLNGQTTPAPLLHIGLNDSTVEGLAKAANHRMYALQCYRNALLQYGRTVRGIMDKRFEEEAGSDVMQDEAELERSIARCKTWIETLGGTPFPQSPEVQLEEALHAMQKFVQESADRLANGGDQAFPDPFNKKNPALIQAMVYDGLDVQSGRGMLFINQPDPGRKEMQGFYLASDADRSASTALEELCGTKPDVYRMLLEMRSELEQGGESGQAVEFVVESGQLHVLQKSRVDDANDALVKMLVEMVKQGSMTKDAALRCVNSVQTAEMRNRNDTIGNISLFLNPNWRIMLGWADEIREQAVFAHIRHPGEARLAREYGADGAFCRIEDCLRSPMRWPYAQKWIQANGIPDRRQGMWRLLPMLQADLEQVLEPMNGCPVAIQLLDRRWIEQQIFNLESVSERDEQGRTSNVPAVDEEWFREWTDMQLEAVFRAALKIIRENWRARPEILLMFANHHEEIQAMAELADDVAEQILGMEKRHCRYRLGHGPEHASQTAGSEKRSNLYYGLGLDYDRRNETNVVNSPVEQLPFTRIAAAQITLAEEAAKRLYSNGNITTTA
ncbi:hypothetical protein [Paenibacillus hubeiensis]|uniref:hypothetical protein n=1 Tax=Paenibacillus hubeiensis TaxID=3077330 RepID=UPI0031B9DFDF